MPRVECSNIKELPGINRMGHTCANLDGDLFFIWGASNEQAAQSSSKDSHLWIYDTLTGYWRHRSCSGECPPYLSGSASALIGQKMYLFGGLSTAQDNWLNCLYCLDLNTFVWKELGSQAVCRPTKPVRSDKCVGWAHSGSFYVFGGYGWSQIEHLLQLLDHQKDFQLAPDFRWPKFGWNNQLVRYEPKCNTWSWPSYTGKCPSARAAHSGALMGDKFYVFGGRDSHQRLNDLYMLDMKTFEWTQIADFLELPVEQPIAHLLAPSDGPEEADQADNVQEVEASASSSSASHQQDPTPTPSSSSHYHVDEDLSSASSTSSHESEDQMTEDEEDDDNEDDDTRSEGHLGSRYPSHMLERWSLASTQSSSSSSQLDGANCNLIQPSPTQILSQPDQLSAPIESEPTDGAPVERRHVDLRPCGRSFASFTPISHKDIMLYGGINSQDKNLDECWLYDTKRDQWRQVDLKLKQTRLWHTASRTKNNEVIVIGGSCSTKVDEFCSDVVSISQEPKSLKRIALDTTAKSIQMRSIQRVKRLPPNIYKLIKLRKQAIAITMRRVPRQILN